MEELVFYDQSGEPVAYSEDHQTVYRFNGQPLGYFDDDSLYAFSGHHIGWFADGWIRDRSGNALVFTPEATGGPMKPIRRLRPIKSIKSIRPIKGIRQIRPIRPIFTLGWSPECL